MSNFPHRPQARSSISSYKPTLSRDMGEQMDTSIDHNSDSSISHGSIDNTMELTSEEYMRERSPVNLNHSSVKKPLPTKNFIEESCKQEPKAQGSNLFKFTIIIVALLAIYVYIQSGEKKCTYERLSKEYPKQDTKMWSTISTAIENILNKRKISPVVNLFIHQGGSDMNQLVYQIADETSKCFGGSLVEMTENDFTSAQVVNDYGHAVNAFKNKIKNGRVAVIVNLNKIPPEAARALHYICDTYTPVAEDIVIFLTLVTATAKGNPVANAENTLNELWGSKLKSNELHPLITRVTDQVLALKPLK